MDERRAGRAAEIDVNDLPAPNATESARNKANLVKRPEGAWPKAPDGFKVEEFARDLENPRVIVAAPNGDLFVAESKAGRVRVLRDVDGDGKPELSEVFAGDLKQPFGIAFHPPGPEPRHIYIANTDAVVRLPYRSGQTKAEGEPEKLVELSGGGQLTGGGHWTRDLVFSRDGKKMFVSVGSKSNVDDGEAENDRARIFEYDPDGKNGRVFAHGIRNPVGLAIHPETGELWTFVNERDDLGDDLVPDYVTRVQEGGFYGWPWFYMGGHQDPRHPGKHPDLKEKVVTPDVLIQSHSASLDLAFYDGSQFPARVSPARLCRRARLLESHPPHRLQSHPHPDGKRKGDRRIHRLPDRLRHAGGRRSGPARRHRGGQRWGLARDRRRRRMHLARELRRAEEMTNEREETSTTAMRCPPGSSATAS